jgi:hypothetical protein
MSIYIVVDEATTVIVSRIVLDDPEQWTVPEGHFIVEETGEPMNIGGTYVDGVYTPPPEPPSVPMPEPPPSPAEIALYDHEERISSLETSTAAAAMPSCAITASTTLAVAKNTPTKINFDTVEFDVTSGFDVVNHRYLPLVAGYYMVNCGCGLVAGTVETYTSIYKNGAEYRRSTTGDSANARLSTLVYLNGTTDYVEGFVISKSNFSTDTSPVLTSFSASLTQAA